MDLREQRQREFADIWLHSKTGGTLNLCPRFGKIRTAIYAFQTYDFSPTILIAYPDGTILKSWKNEFKLMGYDDSNVIYTTHLSLHKYKERKFDIVVLDEIHLLSENQLFVAYELLKINKAVMGLTGTLAPDSKRALRDVLGLNVIAEYTIEQGIKEGVIADYEITVVTVPLDNRVTRDLGKKPCTEKKRVENLSYVINEMQESGMNTKFLRLTRMRVFQDSIAKKTKTRQLLFEYKDERILVFCGLTKVADTLGIPSYHSKSSEKGIFNDFVKGDIPHLAVCKIGNTGVTYKPLNRVIINYTDSNPENLTQKINRCMSMEYDNPGKKALITIVSTNEDVELNWVKKGLAFFDKSKIKYI